MNQYIVFTREGNELMVVGSYATRELAMRNLKHNMEPGTYSLATILVLDGTVRPPERRLEANIFEGGKRFIKRNQPPKVGLGNARREDRPK